MSLCARGVRIARRTRCHINVAVADLPMFLCPAWIGIIRRQHQRQQLYSTSAQTHLTASRPSQVPHAIKPPNQASLPNRLPPQCAGCGALSQTIDKYSAGYYNLKRRSVNEYLKGEATPRRSEEDAIVEKSLQAAADVAPGVLSELGISVRAHRPG
jgi:genetic interactor of prohibitins 3, mitochondrial